MKRLYTLVLSLVLAITCSYLTVNAFESNYVDFDENTIFRVSEYEMFEQLKESDVTFYNRTNGTVLTKDDFVNQVLLLQGLPIGKLLELNYDSDQILAI